MAVYSQDGAESLHRRLADESHALPKAGAIAYLDIDAILRVSETQAATPSIPATAF